MQSQVSLTEGGRRSERREDAILLVLKREEGAGGQGLPGGAEKDMERDSESLWKEHIPADPAVDSSPPE